MNVKIFKESENSYFSNLNIKNVIDNKKYRKRVKTVSQINLMTLKI